MSESDSSAVWYCRFCDQENLTHSNFCEACGKPRGSVPEPGERTGKPVSDAGARLADAASRVASAASQAADQLRSSALGAAAARFLQRREGERPADPEAEPQHRAPETEDAGRHRKVRMRFLHLTDRLRGAFTRETYHEVLSDRSNPATNMLIAFLVWGIFRMVGYVPLMIFLRALAFLMGPFGLVVILALSYVYSKHHQEIDARVATMRARARAFRRAAESAAGSISWLRGRIRDRSSAGPDDITQRRGTSVRLLEDEDDGDTYEVPDPTDDPRKEGFSGRKADHPADEPHD